MKSSILNAFWLLKSAFDIPLSDLVSREANTQQQRGLVDIVMGVAQNAHSTRLHHEVQVKVKRIAQPTLSKASGKVAVSNDDNVGRLLAIHVRALNFLDLGNEMIDTFGDLSGGLAVEAAVTPDVPRVLGSVEALFDGQFFDLFWFETLESAVTKL